MGYNVFCSCCQLATEIGEIKSEKKNTRGQEAAVATDKISVSEMERREWPVSLHQEVITSHV